MPLPNLPPAVEVAAYRIAVEALLNVVRHAEARRCEVRLALGDDELEVDMVDDGRGVEGGSSGVGTRAMRERAAEVGGEVTIEPGATGGTLVVARLPVDLSASRREMTVPRRRTRTRRPDPRPDRRRPPGVPRRAARRWSTGRPTWCSSARQRPGREAVALAASEHPAIVLMDLRMPEMTGIEATREILAADPSIGVLIITMSEDDDSLFAAMRAGARGYIPKDADAGELLQAIRAAAVGEAIFGASIASRLMTFFAGGARSTAAFPELTERELEILELIAAGPLERRDRAAAGDRPEDRPQSRRERPQQARGGRPEPGDRAGPRGGPRRRGLSPVDPNALERS